LLGDFSRSKDHQIASRGGSLVLVALKDYVIGSLLLSFRFRPFFSPIYRRLAIRKRNVGNADATRTSRYGISRTDQWKLSARYLHFRMRIIYIADSLLDSTNCGRIPTNDVREDSRKRLKNRDAYRVVRGRLLSKTQIRRYNSQAGKSSLHQALNYATRDLEYGTSQFPNPPRASQTSCSSQLKLTLYEAVLRMSTY
jgi:hypothetical protein